MQATNKGYFNELVNWYSVHKKNNQFSILSQTIRANVGMIMQKLPTQLVQIIQKGHAAYFIVAVAWAMSCKRKTRLNETV